MAPHINIAATRAKQTFFEMFAKKATGFGRYCREHFACDIQPVADTRTFRDIGILPADVIAARMKF
ncbi:MAG: hypothetical protein R3D43_00685 [Tepidamorphaceae bacterium]|nr:hypothetical protein [Rhodobiaceae bacterium]MCC0047763.1 hypothetical protein [Rhodobiaceae bacterium]